MYGERYANPERSLKELKCFHRIKKTTYYAYTCEKCGFPYDPYGLSIRYWVWVLLGRVERVDPKEVTRVVEKDYL